MGQNSFAVGDAKVLRDPLSYSARTVSLNPMTIFGETPGLRPTGSQRSEALQVTGKLPVPLSQLSGHCTFRLSYLSL